MWLRAILACLVMVCSCRACEKQRSAVDATGSRREAAQCGPGQQDNPARAAAVRALLAKVKAGRGLWSRAPAGLQICFVESGVPSIATDGVITLDRRAADAESAARLGHLLLHAVEGSPLPDKIPPSRSCAEVVQNALGAEARAHARELTLRRQLGIPLRDGHPFEQAFWAAPEPRRVELLRAYFRAHPAGGAGLPGYVSAYTQRCNTLKSTHKEGP